MAPLFLALCLLPVGTEEAVLPDGRRLTGTLAFAHDVGLRFTPFVGGPALTLDEASYVRCPARSVPPLRVPAFYRILLTNEQSLTGQLQGLDEDSLHLRTSWADR